MATTVSVLDGGSASYMDRALSILVVGASGDLAAKKTYPSLLALYRGGLVPPTVLVIGYARSVRSDDDFRTHLRARLNPGGAIEEVTERFLKRCYYRSGNYDDEKRVAEVYREIARLEAEEAPGLPVNRLFYFAIPPEIFAVTARSVSLAGRTASGWNRFIIEKPFGRDLKTFEHLNQQIKDILDENSIYRIDHYLGKESVQNLLTMRFSNAIFEPLWNRHHVSSVTISFKENFGAGGRGYFDEYGIIRDVCQNHLTQVLSLFAMEAPANPSGDAIRDEKRKVLQAIQPIKLENCITAQYAKDDDGKFKSYTDEDKIPRDSRTPTFATLVLFIDNARWEGVPFILRAGKALNERKSEIRVQFRKSAGSSLLFPQTKPGQEPVARNELVIRVQPNEAVYMKINVKQPGLDGHPVTSELDLSYNTRYPELFRELPEAYTRLILQTLRGDSSSFVRDDELRLAWEIFNPVLSDIDAGKNILLKYKAGTRGPVEHDELAKKFGYINTGDYQWRPPHAKG